MDAGKISFLTRGTSRLELDADGYLEFTAGEKINKFSSFISDINNLLIEVPTSDAVKQYADGTLSSNEDGYIKLSSGLIIQWGFRAYGESPFNITSEIIFPITFPYACFSVVAETSITATASNWKGVKIADKSTTGFKGNTHSKDNLSQDAGYNWMAIGI